MKTLLTFLLLAISFNCFSQRDTTRFTLGRWGAWADSTLGTCGHWEEYRRADIPVGPTDTIKLNNEYSGSVLYFYFVVLRSHYAEARLACKLLAVPPGWRNKEQEETLYNYAQYVVSFKVFQVDKK